MPNPRPETNEIAYTTKKIESNFSNFSAWHQRSKVFASLWEKGELDEAKCKEEGQYYSRHIYTYLELTRYYNRI